MKTTPLALALSLAFSFTALAPAPAFAQAVMGTCASCGGDTGDVNCGACIANGTACFNALPAAERRNTTFETSDHHDARTLHFARLVGGVGIAPDINRAVNRTYAGNNVWNYYGASGDPRVAGYCAAAGNPPPAFSNPGDYRFSDHRLEDTFNGLDCYNGEVDRYYLSAPGHADGDRVCDGEQGFFDPAHGAIFDLGGEGNRVAVFPFTDHPPLPCESFEYSVWLSDNPMATQVAAAGHPDSTKWNPAVLTRAFLQGWIPDMPAPADETAALHPDLSNPSQRDGIVQVFALPCGLTFRYASIVAGNNGNPAPACVFYSFDAELDAVAGLNEDDTAICPDADGDGFRDHACGGDDCNDADATVHPGALETCSSGRDLNCDGVASSCPSGTTCIQGYCATNCIEGACADGFTCTTSDAGSAQYCVPAICAGVTCPAGQLCGPSGCQDPCEGAHCPVGEVCRGGTCAEPCAGVVCPTHQHCEANSMGVGRCVIDCACSGCTAPLTCSATTGRCGAPTCGMLPCDPPSRRDCSGATERCVAACDMVTCPVGQRCDATSGNCARDACFGVACAGGSHCENGMCVADARPDAGGSESDGAVSDGGAGMDGGVRGDSGVRGDGSVRADGGTGGASSGCGCTTAGRDASGHSGLAALALAVSAVIARRRKQRAQ